VTAGATSAGIADFLTVVVVAVSGCESASNPTATDNSSTRLNSRFSPSLRRVCFLRGLRGMLG
jgi:hypothetical protein